MTDLLNADKKGKWWLVGAGWSGNPLVEHEQQPVRQVQEADDTEEAALYDLARKQGMNTDVRRSVFVVLLTSEVSSLPYEVLTSRITFMLVTGCPTCDSPKYNNENASESHYIAVHW